MLFFFQSKLIRIFFSAVAFTFFLFPISVRAESTSETLFALINAERARNGETPLTRDPQVDQLATAWASTMASQGRAEHRPLTKDLLNSHGWKNLSENIYGPVSGPASAKAIFQAWMGSSGHRDNLLRSSSKLGGVGVVTTSSGSVYAVFNAALPVPPVQTATSSASASTNDNEVAFPGVGIPDFVPKMMRDPAAALPSNSDGRKLNQLGRTNL